MSLLDVNDLIVASVPVMDRFAAIEPKPWTRKTLILELIGEIGSLAHLVQYWDGFKRGRPTLSMLADESSDVLFIILRLARAEGIALPQTVAFGKEQHRQATDLVLELSRCAADLLNPASDLASGLVAMLMTLGGLTNLLGVDLAHAHHNEMEIALCYFEASGKYWPRPQLLRYPTATFRLARLLWKKRMNKRMPKDI